MQVSSYLLIVVVPRYVYMRACYQTINYYRYSGNLYNCQHLECMKQHVNLSGELVRKQTITAW